MQTGLPPLINDRVLGGQRSKSMESSGSHGNPAVSKNLYGLHMLSSTFKGDSLGTSTKLDDC